MTIRSASVVLLLLCAGCWSTRLAEQDVLSPPDRPRTGTKDPTKPPDTPTRGPTEVRGFEDEDCHLTILKGPVAINIRRAAPRNRLLNERAVVRIDLPVGHDRHPVGLAELTALVVSDAPDGSANRPALRQRIAELGGDLTFTVGREWTRFSATVPAIRWTEALYEIANRLQRVRVGHAVFQQLQDRMISHYIGRWRSAPLLSQVRLWVHSDRPRHEIVEGIQDRTLPEVVLFHRRHYQPRGVSIGVWVPGAPEDSSYLLERVKSALLEWKAAPLPKRVGEQTDAVTPAAGVRWMETDAEMSSVAIFVPVSPGTPEWLTMLETFTMDGIGGRLGTVLRLALGHEPLFHAHEYGDFNDRYLILETEVRPDAVLMLYEALQEAWGSLAKSPPTGHELEAARRRARLRLLQRQDRADPWFEAAALRLIRRQNSGPAQELIALNEMKPDALGRISGEWAAAPIGMLVSGGEVPASAPSTFQKIKVSIPDYRRPTKVDIAVAQKDATKYLDLAVEALGDPRRLRLSPGFEIDEDWRGTEDIDAKSSTRYRFPDQINRRVEILGSAVTTDVNGSAGREHLGEEEIQLSVDEASSVTSELQRHPVALLMSYVRKSTKFGLVGMRTRRARRVALIERIDAEKPRLRFTVDVESGLIRDVETTVRRPDVGLVELRDSFSDYRKSDGLRVPWHRLTTVDHRLAVDGKVTAFRFLER